MAVNPWRSEDGRKAYAVLDWVNEDPDARAAEGLDRLAALGGEAETTRSLHEVQDVARVVTRLIPEGGTHDTGGGAVPPGVGPA